MGIIAELKQQVVEQLLQQEDFFLVVVDPRHREVRLPEYLTESEQPVGLSIGLRMAVPIPDLEVDENGIQGTLSFSRTPFYCFIPWSALVQVSSNEEHLVWVLPAEEPVDSLSANGSDGDSKPRLRLV